MRIRQCSTFLTFHSYAWPTSRSSIRLRPSTGTFVASDFSILTCQGQDAWAPGLDKGSHTPQISRCLVHLSQRSRYLFFGKSLDIHIQLVTGLIVLASTQISTILLDPA